MLVFNPSTFISKRCLSAVSLMVRDDRQVLFVNRQKTNERYPKPDGLRRERREGVASHLYLLPAVHHNGF